MNRVEALTELIRYSTHAELKVPSVLFEQDNEKFHIKKAMETLINESDLKITIEQLDDDLSKVTLKRV